MSQGEPDASWSTPQLLDLAIARATASGADDTDAYREPIRFLHRREPKEVFALIAPLAMDADTRLRSLVPEVLRFLGGRPQPLLAETVALFRQMLAKEKSADVIASIGAAFVDLRDAAGAELMEPYAAHADQGVREVVVHALLTRPDERSVALWITMTSDAAPEVRNAATFALGSQIDADSEAIRDALVRRLSDPADEVRAEAILGLALRGDGRALAKLKAGLASDDLWPHYVDAAFHLASPDLCEVLHELEDTADEETLAFLAMNAKHSLRDAIVACDDAAARS